MGNFVTLACVKHSKIHDVDFENRLQNEMSKFLGGLHHKIEDTHYYYAFQHDWKS